MWYRINRFLMLFLLTSLFLTPLFGMDTSVQKEQQHTLQQAFIKTLENEQRKARIFNYVFDTSLRALFTGMQAAEYAQKYKLPKKYVPPFVGQQIASDLVERTTVSLARESVIKALGCKEHGHKEVVNWGVDFGRKGIKYRLSLDKKSSHHWIRNFLFKIFVPSFARHMTVDLVHNAIVQGIGIDYPEWIKKRWYLYAFAIEIPRLAQDFLGMGYDFIMSLGNNKKSSN